MKALFTVLAVCLVLLPTLVFSQGKVVYKVVHADGSVTYTDVPQPGAVAIDTNTANSVTMPRMSTPPPPVPVAKARPQSSYDLLIIQPQPEASIRSNNGNVTIRANLSPSAAGNYRLLLDEKLAGHSQNGDFALQNVDRGEHKLQIQFIDNSGKIIASSPTQRFYLHRASLLINRN